MTTTTDDYAMRPNETGEEYQARISAPADARMDEFMGMLARMTYVDKILPGDVLTEDGTEVKVIAVAPQADNGEIVVRVRIAGRHAIESVTLHAGCWVEMLNPVERYPAIDLYRNARVRLALDEVAYLVDHIERRDDGSCRVTYSGDVVRDYASGAMVNAR